MPELLAHHHYTRTVKLSLWGWSCAVTALYNYHQDAADGEMATRAIAKSRTFRAEAFIKCKTYFFLFFSLREMNNYTRVLQWQPATMYVMCKDFKLFEWFKAAISCSCCAHLWSISRSSISMIWGKSTSRKYSDAGWLQWKLQSHILGWDSIGKQAKHINHNLHDNGLQQLGW